jgi:integrase
MASLEIRGSSVRVSWLLGGRRGGAKQSCTFTGPSEKANLKLAEAAKALVESRGHDMTRPECYEAILGTQASSDAGPVPTFRMWAQTWITDRRAGVGGFIQADVANRYEQCLTTRAVPFLGQQRITDITREDIKAWVRWMAGSRVTYGNRNRRVGDKLLAAQTIGKHFMIVSSCLAAAVPKWIEVNPAAPLPGEGKNSVGLPAPGPFEGMFLTGDEVRLILDHCGPDLHDLVYVATRTGMRIGELLALEAQNVVFPRAGGATVLVRKGLKSDGTVGSPKSPASRRDIPVTGTAADILARRVKGRKPSGLVFLSPRGVPWNVSSLRYKHFGRAVAAARRCPEHPLPAPPPGKYGPGRLLRNDEVSACDCPGVLRRAPRFHDLRHTHASALIANGWHFKKIQRRLGHARFQTTMDVYGHLVDLGGADELDGLEGFFAPPPVSRRPRTAGPARQHVQRARARKLLVRRAAT